MTVATVTLAPAYNPGSWSTFFTLTGTGAEAVVLAFVGWALGVLVGWLIYEGLVALLLQGAAISLPKDFPPAILLITLVGLLLLGMLVIRGPLRRATPIRHGTALRYQ